MMQEKILDLIALNNGCTYKEIKKNLGSTGVWNSLKVLTNENKVISKKVGNSKYYIVKEKLEPKINANDVEELKKLLLETVSEEVKQKVISEFGALQVKHEIKISDKPSVTIKAELPECFDSILAYAVNGNAVMMTGPAGTGKGFLARQIAFATGSKFFEVNAVKNSYDLTGFVDANSNFVRTPFYDACKTVAEGGKAVFLFDEMDCSEPEVLKIFNEALASFEFTFPNDEYFSFENLIILCACNTMGTGADEAYCGEQLDASTLDRFAMVRVDYNRKTELSISNGDEELVDFIDSFRKQTEENGLMFVASYRSIKRIVSMRGVLPLKQVMKECFLKSMGEDDLKNILNNMQEKFKDNVYFQACKGKNVKWRDNNGQYLLIA